MVSGQRSPMPFVLWRFSGRCVAIRLSYLSLSSLETCKEGCGEGCGEGLEGGGGAGVACEEACVGGANISTLSIADAPKECKHGEGWITIPWP